MRPSPQESAFGESVTLSYKSPDILLKHTCFHIPLPHGQPPTLLVSSPALSQHTFPTSNAILVSTSKCSSRINAQTFY